MTTDMEAVKAAYPDAYFVDAIVGCGIFTAFNEEGILLAADWDEHIWRSCIHVRISERAVADGRLQTWNDTSS
jgi:hypothetical protein